MLQKRWFGCLLALLALGTTVARSEVKLSTMSWEKHPDEFVSMQNDVAIGHVLNFMNFPDARIVESPGIGAGSHVALTDSLVGELGGIGRIGAEGKPSRLVVYLGKPRSIKEICVYTGNIDSRANQDYEIRLVNNAANPGQKPAFPANPTFTTGDKILGTNGGGFKTSFREEEAGKFLGNEKYDWVEFRFWNTYPSKAGDPGKGATKANSWCSLIEVQIIGDESDPGLYNSEEEKVQTQEAMARRAFEQRLAQISPDLVQAIDQMNALEMAIDDIAQTYPEYDGAAYKAELAKYRGAFQNLNLTEPAVQEKALKIAEEFLQFRRKALLSNPLLKFDKVLVRTARNPGLEANWMSNCSRGKGDYGNLLQTLSLSDPEANLTPLVEPLNNSYIGDICLHWDAKRILVTALSDKRTWEVFEVHLDKPTEFKQISPFMGPDIDNVEGCYVPDGAHLFISSASMMGVPCIGGAGHVGNIFRVEADGKTVRQLTFEQDQDWCPVVLNNGRIMYLRWEYVDDNHYFTRIMMHMNPDGSDQKEYYGSNSYWPNSMFYAKPLPGPGGRFVTIVTGHHGAAQRQGELHIIDPKLGRQEADGVVQQIPFRGKKVEPRIVDNLVDASWPKFLFPFPLSDKYFLVSARPTANDPWGLYLVDVFDNMLLIKESTSFGIFEPQALVERPVPPVVASRLIEGEKDSTVFITDVYFGPGLQGVPRGTVKKLRLFSYQYGYRGIGNHDMMGIEASWDSKVLLGEVPVYEDGSAFFRIPSNTPIAVQPLDEEGNAIQLMRSWLVGMPGEGVTCTGCHESQNSVTPAKRTIAMTRPPVPIQEFNGPSRPMGFNREVQPVLDKYCVGCHDGSEPGRPNLKDTSRPKDSWGGHFGRSYIDLMPFVRRPGPESDVHMFNPMEYHSNTSPLFQMLRDGNHYNVKLDPLAWQSLALWVDMNAPYHATWTEVSEAFRGNSDGVKKMAERTREIRSLYANLHDDPEHGSHFQVDRPEFVKPEEWVKPDTKAPEGATMQVGAADASKLEVELGEGVKMELVRIPTGKFVIGDDFGHPDEANRNLVEIQKPFYMGTTEVTNEMYALFDKHHNSRYIDQQWKDHTWPGYAHNFPQQPVIRITWQEAMEFCQWLSKKTGKKFRLPTEAEWEWAAKAGKDQPFWWGGLEDDFGKYANLADRSLRLFVVKGVNPQPPKSYAEYEAFLPRIDTVDDGQMYPGWDTETHANAPASVDPGKGIACYEPNPWGLYDMNGNVAEWTLSDFQPYPYVADDGRNAGNADGLKVVRGGSWFDRPKTARNGYRLPYKSWQRVYNVGFRVVCEE